MGLDELPQPVGSDRHDIGQIAIPAACTQRRQRGFGGRIQAERNADPEVLAVDAAAELRSATFYLDPTRARFRRLEAKPAT